MPFFDKTSSPGETKVYGGRYTAEFGMWQFDYPRISNLLERADIMFIQALDGDVNVIEPLSNILKALYYNFRPLIYDTKREWFEDTFKVIKHLLKHWKNDSSLRKKVPYSLIEKEEDLYRELYQAKQLIGLGFKTIKKESDMTKLKRAFGTGD
jgi:hypothetical protein